MRKGQCRALMTKEGAIAIAYFATAILPFTLLEKPGRFLPENIVFATFLKCACSSALFTA